MCQVEGLRWKCGHRFVVINSRCKNDLCMMIGRKIDPLLTLAGCCCSPQCCQEKMDSYIDKVREIERQEGMEPGSPWPDERPQQDPRGREVYRKAKVKFNASKSNAKGDIKLHAEICLPRHEAGMGFTNERRLAQGQPLLPPQRVILLKHPQYLEEDPELSNAANKAMQTSCARYNRALYKEAEVREKIVGPSLSSMDLEGEEGLVQQLKYSTEEAEGLRQTMRRTENLLGDELLALPENYRALLQKENEQFPWRLSGLVDRNTGTGSSSPSDQPTSSVQSDDSSPEQQENLLLDIHQTWNNSLELPKRQENVQTLLNKLSELFNAINAYQILGDKPEYYPVDYVLKTRKLVEMRKSLERLGDRVEQSKGKSIIGEEYTELVNLCTRNREGLKVPLQNLEAWLGEQNEKTKAEIQRLQNDENHLETKRIAQQVDSFVEEMFT